MPRANVPLVDNIGVFVVDSNIALEPMALERISNMESQNGGGRLMMRDFPPVRVIASPTDFVAHSDQFREQHRFRGLSVPVGIAISAGSAPRGQEKHKEGKTQDCMREKSESIVRIHGVTSLVKQMVFLKPKITARATRGQGGGHGLRTALLQGIGLVSLLMAVGCSSSPGDPDVQDRAQVEFQTEWRGNSIPSGKVQQRIQATLGSTHEAMALRKGLEGLGDCIVLFKNIAEKMPDGVIAVGTGAKLRCIRPTQKFSVSTTSVIDESDLAPPTTEEEWSALMVNVLARLDLRLQVATSEDDGVTKWLEHASSAARSQAISECSTRELQRCVPKLLERMEDPLPVGAEAIGAVGLLGNEKVLSALVKLTAAEDPETLLAVLYAIESIGGTKAMRYMREIGDTHVVPGVASTAKTLLARMKEKR